jgi:hypothetical protein
VASVTALQWTAGAVDPEALCFKEFYAELRASVPLFRGQYLDPVLRKQCRRHALPWNETVAEAAIVDLTMPTRWATWLHHGPFDA